MKQSLNVILRHSDAAGGGNGGAVATGPADRTPPTTAIRYGKMNQVGEFTLPGKMKLGCGAKVIVATDRGIEIGEQLSLNCPGCSKIVSREQIKQYVKSSGPNSYRLSNGRILRVATAEDLSEFKHIELQTREKLRLSQRLAQELGLAMEIVECEHLFGGERIVLYFMSEQRVDFRELVRRLAAEFQTRIEMRQVGARDEARLLADYETCGRECCCKNFLKDLKPVNMHMAKMQKATLDPSKVSGRCGRLKCCMRYENESYQELAAKLPRMGSWVRTAEVTGQVIDRQILSQLVRLADAQGRLSVVSVDDIQQRDMAPPARSADGAAEESPQRRHARPDRRSEPPRPPAAVAQKPPAPPPPPPMKEVRAEAEASDFGIMPDEVAGPSPGEEPPSVTESRQEPPATPRQPPPAAEERRPPQDRRRRRGGRRSRGRSGPQGPSRPGPAGPS